jgi:hypothetical protein
MLMAALSGMMSLSESPEAADPDQRKSLAHSLLRRPQPRTLADGGLAEAGEARHNFATRAAESEGRAGVACLLVLHDAVATHACHA